MEHVIEKTKFDVLISSLHENFPKAKREYNKKYSEFDVDALKLFEWFSLHDGSNVPSDACDEIWHNMILYTEKYFDWCVEYFGRVIHHIPNDKDGCSGGTCKGCSGQEGCTGGTCR